MLCSVQITRAQTATIVGVIVDSKNEPLENVHISSLNIGSYSNKNGFYLLQIVADTETTITFSHIGHKNIILKKLLLTTNETYEFNPIMSKNITQIDEVTVTPTGNKSVTGITILSPKMVRKIPGANAGVENILKLLPGVTSNNELSTQFSVRGGNYDENLVYVNEIEIYRPFLIRSGQQEGLSFVNSNLVQSLKFSSGGFQAKYGDKLSSVLDITYKSPTEFAVQANVNLLGAGISLETISENKKLSSITGIRHRDNSLLVNSKQTKTNYNPLFIDLQHYTTYYFSKKLRLNFLGNLSINKYRNKPLTRQTNFGTLNNPKAFLVSYKGEEKNTYTTALGAIKATYLLNENTTLKLISSLYHTKENEYSDIIASYSIGEIETDLTSDNLGEVTSSKGVGSQYNRARNNLDALIFTIKHKGSYVKDNQAIAWGLKYTYEDIRDQIRESEFIDSLGFFIRPPLTDFNNNQPETPFTTPITPFEGVNARNFIQINRISGFLQYSNQKEWNSHNVYYNIGIRGQHWIVSGKRLQSSSHSIISPRVQFAIKPNWEKDMLFRISGGLYQQPPFYRELRNKQGNVISNVKAQKSLHLVAGNEYSFTMWSRPFKLTSEIYYKKLSDVNRYTLEDVRIRYAANNNAKAYAYGFETRLNGAFVPGTESWVSLGYLKTEENNNNKGYISRPSDQRLKLGILFQDYIPRQPHLRMYLNLVYSTGVPGGSPNYANPYEYQHRLKDYKRVDWGISHIFVDNNKQYPENHWLHRFKELYMGIEIFNLFNNQNSITNTWVRDAESKQQFAVPNFMTSRVLNLKLNMRF
ncbi:MAG: carboxypeptidase-like regulatory domain-containing protein [Cellulophaga sp.]